MGIKRRHIYVIFLRPYWPTKGWEDETTHLFGVGGCARFTIYSEGSIFCPEGCKLLDIHDFPHSMEENLFPPHNFYHFFIDGFPIHRIYLSFRHYWLIMSQLLKYTVSWVWLFSLIFSGRLILNIPS